MTLTDLASIGSLISSVAVLLSLIYLAQQTRQNSKHTRALIQQGRALQSIDMPERCAENPVLAAIRLRGDEGDTSLDRVEFSQYWLMRVAIFWLWEDQFYQHKDGLLESDRFAGTVRVMESQFRTPGCRYTWKLARVGFASEFQAFMDDVMSRTQAARFDQLASWKAGIGAELPETAA